jgi:probable rRNA maturation factor
MTSASSRARRAPSRPNPSFSRRVDIANRHPHLRLERRAIENLIHVLDANHAAIGVPASRVPHGELSLVFLTDPALAELHAEFLDDPTTTDVITFEGENSPGLPAEAMSAGEICVSVDTAANYARSHDREFSKELTLYLVHGWLHLVGFDDLVPAKKRAMRRAEARAMRVLQAAQALPEFKLKRPAKRTFKARPADA